MARFQGRSSHEDASDHESEDEFDTDSEFEGVAEEQDALPERESKTRGTEKVIWYTDATHAGYVVVRKGNTYMTRNCRRRALEDGKDVYTIMGWSNTSSPGARKKEKKGISVPKAIFDSVQREERNSSASRELAVQKRDQKIAKELEASILEQFALIPPSDLAGIVQQSTTKHKGRVGRSSSVPLPRRACLAVVAWIRHKYTPYDSLLNSGVPQKKARKRILKVAERMLETWRGPKSQSEKAARLTLERRENKNERASKPRESRKRKFDHHAPEESDVGPRQKRTRRQTPLVDS